MARQIRLDAREKARINRENAAGKKWQNEDPEHIVRCYDLYKQGRMTSRQLFEHFPGRTMKAIESKVWKIRGRRDTPIMVDPDQGNLFTAKLEAHE